MPSELVVLDPNQAVPFNMSLQTSQVCMNKFGLHPIP